jgi:hypothetical protein
MGSITDQRNIGELSPSASLQGEGVTASRGRVAGIPSEVGQSAFR